MSTTHFHVCLDLAGALRLSDRDIRSLFENHGYSARQGRKQLELWLHEGKKVVPFGEACPGFSYEKGCPGHPVEPRETQHIQTEGERLGDEQYRATDAGPQETGGSMSPKKHQLKLSNVSGVIIGEVVTFKADREDDADRHPYVDRVTDVILRWAKEWTPFEIMTALYPEMPGEGGIIPIDRILDSRISEHIPCDDPAIPETPPYDVGQRIRFDAGSGVEEGTISVVECHVSADRNVFLFAIAEQPNMAEIEEDWILGVVQAEAKAV